jgi:hypothetical protein
VQHLLKSHVEVYYMLKKAAADAGRDIRVGIVKDLFQFHPHKVMYAIMLCLELAHLFCWRRHHTLSDVHVTPQAAALFR